MTNDPIRDDSTPPCPPLRIVGEVVGEFVPRGQSSTYAEDRKNMAHQIVTMRRLLLRCQALLRVSTLPYDAGLMTDLERAIGGENRRTAALLDSGGPTA